MTDGILKRNIHRALIPVMRILMGTGLMILMMQTRWMQIMQKRQPLKILRR